MRKNNFSEILRIMNYVERNYQRALRVSDIARALGYSTMHCAHLFKTFLGEPIGSYLRTLRMRQAKEDLLAGRSVADTAKALSFRPRGFRKAFRDHYGVSPLEFLKTGETHEQFVKTYEWRASEQNWGKGENPTADGLWEFAYCDTKGENYTLMEWYDELKHFRAPFTCTSDPTWYCRNRSNGTGMRPGRASRPVRSFICPHSGRMEVFFSVGRLEPVNPKGTPVSVQLYHNGRPLEEPMVLTDLNPRFLSADLSVRAGDRVSLHADPMGDYRYSGVLLYRQRFRYSEITED